MLKLDTTRIISRGRLRFPEGHFILITSLYWIVSAILFAKYGIKNVNDSARYLEYSKNLLNGFYIDDHNIWYIGYAYFLMLVSFVSEKLWALILFQYLLGYLSTLLIYQASLILFNKYKSALIASLCMILYIEIPMWNSYILAESFYVSCITFSVFFLVNFIFYPSRSSLVFAVFTIALTFLIKPTGIALLAASIAVFVAFIIIGGFNTWIKILVSGTIIISILALSNRMLLTYRIMENYELGEVIYAISTLPPSAKYNGLIIIPPNDLEIPGVEYPPLIRVMIFIVNHPLYWLKLFMAKLFYFLAHIRPYWSIWHNLFSILFLVPIYFFFIRGVVGREVNSYFRIFALCYVIMHIVSVCVTSEDWDGRFLVPILPVIFLLSSHSMGKLIVKESA